MDTASTQPVERKTFAVYIIEGIKPIANLIERHLPIVGNIAGQIAWKRCPKSFGIWAKEASPHLSHVALVHELAAIGNMAMFIAEQRYDPKTGYAFSTYANPWIKKFIRLYLEELLGVVPRTGHMGIEAQGVGPCGPWVVYKPRRSVMDLLDAAIDGRRLYRGKAAGGMAVFDSGLTIPGPNPGDKEIELVSTEGPTDATRLDYLQRRVGKLDFPWTDMGALFTPRLWLLGHTNTGGRAYDGPPKEEAYEIESEPMAESDPGPSILPAEICYLNAKPSSSRYRVPRWRKPIIGERAVQASPPPRWLPPTHWIMTDRGWRRGRLGMKQWHKPTYEEHEYEAEIRREDATALAA
jgi:hypothetical protein